MKKSVLLIVLIIFFITINSGCKNMAKPEIERVWGTGERLLKSLQSMFYVQVHFWNDIPGIEIRLEYWNLRIFENDNLIFEFNSSNYKDFEYQVMASSSFYLTGEGMLKIGIPDTYFLGYVDGDLYKGSKPNKIEFTCTIKDMNDYEHNLSVSGQFDFKELDS